MKRLLLFAAILAIAVSCGNKKTAPAPADQVAETAQVVPDEQAIELIKDFYVTYVFGEEFLTDDSVDKFCTAELKQQLKDDFDYEGEGYAIWDFSQSEAGDNMWKGDVEVEPLGGGKYKVSFTENDVKKSVTLTLVADGDRILFSSID